MNSVKAVVDNVGTFVPKVLDNKVFMIVLAYIFIIHSVDTFTTLPGTLQTIILSCHTKILLVFCLVFYSTRNFKTSLLAAVAFFILWGCYSMYAEGFDTISNSPDVYPGCQNTTTSDLLSLFDGDQDALKRSMASLGVPLNLTLTDENSPKIATYFINHGHKITQNCRAPE